MSPREKLEIEEALIHSPSWKAFKTFLEERKTDLISQSIQTVELKDVLVRENAIGGLMLLNSLIDDFRSHIDRNTTKED